MLSLQLRVSNTDKIEKGEYSVFVLCIALYKSPKRKIFSRLLVFALNVGRFLVFVLSREIFEVLCKKSEMVVWSGHNTIGWSALFRLPRNPFDGFFITTKIGRLPPWPSLWQTTFLWKSRSPSFLKGLSFSLHIYDLQYGNKVISRVRCQNISLGLLGK